MYETQRRDTENLEAQHRTIFDKQEESIRELYDVKEKLAVITKDGIQIKENQNHIMIMQKKAEENLTQKITEGYDNSQKKFLELLQKSEENNEKNDIDHNEVKNTLAEIKETQSEMLIKSIEEINLREENLRETRELVRTLQDDREKRNLPNENTITELLETEKETQRNILETLLEFKFEYLGNQEKANREVKEAEDPIDIKEEFRAIDSENLMAIKRIMPEVHLEVVQPIITIQENIERN
jgi:hypothetical protein